MENIALNQALVGTLEWIPSIKGVVSFLLTEGVSLKDIILDLKSLNFFVYNRLMDIVIFRIPLSDDKIKAFEDLKATFDSKMRSFEARAEKILKKSLHSSKVNGKGIGDVGNIDITEQNVDEVIRILNTTRQESQYSEGKRRGAKKSRHFISSISKSDTKYEGCEELKDIVEGYQDTIKEYELPIDKRIKLENIALGDDGKTGIVSIDNGKLRRVYLESQNEPFIDCLNMPSWYPSESKFSNSYLQGSTQK